MSQNLLKPLSIDPKSLGRVAVLFGGTSAERDVSIMSGTGVLKALQAQGVDAFAFDPAERPLQELKAEGVDRCFIALHGRGGEDGTVQGALELLGIPYTGSGVMASSIAMDKVMTKRIWRFEGLPTPDWRIVASATECEQALAVLGAPMIVKPAREGSSIGLTKVTDVAQCAAAYAAAAQHDPEVLCEQFIEGEETTCPVLIVEGEAQALPVIRIVAPGGNYDYQNKYFTDEVKYLCPSELDAAEEAEIQREVVRAFKTLGCRGWARADVMIRRSDRQPFLLEINTSPGMTGHSLVPMSAKVAGLSYEQLCVHLLASATLDRNA
ncbi:D-alanine--D-alanine ligase [Aquabacterium parvum]|uniref:D-alanine--D-alanine ligase n=1 Tax=Aquabacterium parvum TaxID=70584 RepID=UPI000718C861|nr:D-alanine--D-alanine ligase [Aquabacterium parvum]MBU0916494.1 D-alanine--D-alanine ligase [Gammaproteobacteria bacterium]